MKKETDKEGEMVAEAPRAPEAEEQQVEQVPEASEEEADFVRPSSRRTRGRNSSSKRTRNCRTSSFV